MTSLWCFWLPGQWPWCLPACPAAGSRMDIIPMCGCRQWPVWWCWYRSRPDTQLLFMMWLAQVDGPRPQANPTSNPQIYSPDQSCLEGEVKSGLFQLVKLQLRSDNPEAEIFIRIILQLTALVFKVLAFTFQYHLLVRICWREGGDQTLCLVFWYGGFDPSTHSGCAWRSRMMWFYSWQTVQNRSLTSGCKRFPRTSGTFSAIYTIGCRIFLSTKLYLP